MAFLAAINGGGGGIQGGDTASKSGNADVGAITTGAKNINIGGNPNVQTAVTSPYFLGAVVIGLLVWYKARRK